MNNLTDSDYVIPGIDHQILKAKRSIWTFPVSIFLLSLIFFLLGGIDGVGNQFFLILLLSFISTVTVFSIVCSRGNKVQKSIWAMHTYIWYRATFPAHAHTNGLVSCRHCGGHKLNVRNLMNKTYMRAHFCPQCGETLYFSPESH